MSTTIPKAQRAPPLPSPAPVDNDLPTDDEKEPAVLTKSLENMSNTLEQILDVLRGSTIAEERGKDVESKFWATYKKVSNEHDNDFLERANDDMGIILTFAGLFSAVNSTFIIGMQPNPGDTTNILMLQLVKIIADIPNAASDISDLSSSTGYPSSIVWMQTLAYASLAFSVLAAFGAVMGKQWLNSYKAARGRGSLEERGLQRQRKLDGLEYWHLQTVLGTFLVLLQISLLLFGLSLSANMWTQQSTISSIIISTTALGILFYVATILISVLHPDSPFQTAGSTLVGAICEKFHLIRSTFTPDLFRTSSAIRWMIETSTNPEVVEAAAKMVPRVQWPPKLDTSAIYTRLLDTLAMCVDRPELFVTYGKAMAHLRVQSVTVDPNPYKEMDAWNVWHSKGDRSRFIRDAFMDGRLACAQLKDAENEDARQKYEANARTALRTMVVHGRRCGPSSPGNEGLVWYADLRWCHNNGRTPSCEEFDWLIDYLVDKVNRRTDDETQGDTLLALSAMHGLGSSTKRRSYVNTLILCMAPTRPSRVRHAACRAVSDAREELASIRFTNESTSQGLDAILLDKLSRALYTAIHPNHRQTMQGTGSHTDIDDCRNQCYLRLISALAKNDEWCKRLTYHGHIEWCISLHDKVLASPLVLDKFYLADILMHIDPSGKDIIPDPTTQEKWWTLVTKTWSECCWLSPNVIETLPALVTATRQNLPDPNNYVGSILIYVYMVMRRMEKSSANLSQAERILVDVALPVVQGLYDELRGMVEHPNIPQPGLGSYFQSASLRIPL